MGGNTSDDEFRTKMADTDFIKNIVSILKMI